MNDEFIQWLENQKYIVIYIKIDEIRWEPKLVIKSDGPWSWDNLKNIVNNEH